jgi:TonB-linked SusC/RagA family outer membrane protein
MITLRVHFNFLKHIVIPIFLILGATSLQAQMRLLTGKIVSDEGETLIGVNILVQGSTSRGTISDIDGNYSIDVQKGETLVFSYTGFDDQSVLIENQTVVNVELKTAANVLDDIVLIGYGSTKKSDLTGSVASLNGDQLRTSLTTNLDQALQGRVAGVQVTQNSGQPGGAASIRIRGANSISLSSEPLYVIDGLPFQGDGAATPGFDFAGGANGQNRVNPLSSINPNDILSIDVLKDASATAIYGSRGANGVILITTKRGKKGESKISYGTYYGIQTLQRKLDLMSLQQFASYNTQVINEQGLIPDQRFADPSLLGAGTDWQDEVFQNAGSYSHQLTVSGGNDKTTYAIMGGYMQQDGIIIGSSFDRISARLNLDTKVNDWFKIGGSLAFTKNKERITLNDGGDGVIMQSLIMMPSVGVRDIDGNYDGPNIANSGVNYNPVAAALQRNNILERQRLMANVYGDVTLTKGLVFKSEISFDNNHSLAKAFHPTFKWGSIVNNENRLRQREENNFFWAAKNYLTYDKSFGKHNLITMLGTEAQKGTYNGSDITVFNLPSNEIQVLSQGEPLGLPGAWQGGNALLSYFGRFNYNYNEKYLATFTYRGDASSNFGPNNKWAYFPSGSFAWRVGQEDFLKDSKFMTNLKLRLGYGLSGNQNIEAGLFEPLMQTVATPFGPGYRPIRIPNPRLGWETTTQTNYGVDFSIFGDRIDVGLDIYNKQTTDMLLESSVPGYLGGTNYNDIKAPFINVGRMENKGFDLSINSRNINKNKFGWSTDVVFSKNTNKVLEFDSPEKIYTRNLYWYSEFQTATVTRVGQSIGMFWGYQVEGIFQDQADILNHAVQISDKVITEDRPNGSNLVDKRQGVWIGDIKFKDLNGDGVIDTEDQTYIGNPNPDFTFGITNNFRFGPVDVSIFLNGSYGAEILNYARVITEGQTGVYSNQATVVFDRAQEKLIDPNGSALDPANVVLANPGTNIPRPSSNDNNRNNRMSDRFIEDGSYIRLQNIRIGYTLPTSLLSKIRVQRLKVYANLQNMALWTNYSGYDPEIGAFNQSPLVQNVDMGRYPTPRMVTVGLDLDF